MLLLPLSRVSILYTYIDDDIYFKQYREQNKNFCLTFFRKPYVIPALSYSLSSIHVLTQLVSLLPELPS
jgi:hypothetical protein